MYLLQETLSVYFAQLHKFFHQGDQSRKGTASVIKLQISSLLSISNIWTHLKYHTIPHIIISDGRLTRLSIWHVLIF
jgi:hypothetical protein